MPLNILSARISDRIERGATSKAMNVGRTKVYVGSKLYQNFTESMPLHQFDVSHGIRSAADFQSLIDLWYVVNFGDGGPYDGFLFRDWRDFQANQANSICTLIEGSDYQLCRRHTFAGQALHRPIYRPLAGVLIYRTRSAVVSLATATVDYANGVADISGHESGDTYTWVGQFDYPVTFADNEWTGSLEVHTQNLHIRSDPIKLEELRGDFA